MQISATISEETRDLLERTVKRRGLKKGYVIEMALRHYLVALNAFPDEFIVPPVLTVTADSFKRIVDRIEHPKAPTKAMGDLMSGD